MHLRPLVAAVLLLAGCALASRFDDSGERIAAALADLARGGFEFEPDVVVRADPFVVCDGLACADLTVVSGRRTVRVAREALASDARLRAALLEIWERHRAPRPGYTRDLARGALRVLRDGPAVGVTDVRTLRLAHHGYRSLWEQLPTREREGLPDPDSLPFPRESAVGGAPH